MGRTADLRGLAAAGYTLAQREDGEPLYMDILRLRLPKHQRSGSLKPVRIIAILENSNLCPVKTCLHYMSKTEHLREGNTRELFVISRPPYTAISPKTSANWILNSMERGKIDTTVFKAHSINGATASKRVAQGASLEDILKSGRWHTTSTLKKFYLKNIGT